MKLQGQKDLLIALSYAKDITVWEHVFTPKEFLVTHLEEFFSKYVFAIFQFRPINRNYCFIVSVYHSCGTNMPFFISEGHPYLYKTLFFNLIFRTVVKLAMYNEATGEIARPSVLLRNVRVYMSTLHRVEESG